MSEEVIKRIGCFMKNISNEHDKEYRFGFGITHNTFFQKLVPVSIIENGLEIENDEYLRSLLFVDYLVNIIDRGNDEIVRKYDALYKWKKDKDDNYRLDLEAIVMETGLYIKEKPENFLTGKRNVDSMKRLYDEKNTTVDFESKDLKPVDLYYEAIGSMVHRLVSEENKELLKGIKGKYDLKALVFTDTILQYLKNGEEKSKIKSILRLKDKKPKEKIKEYLRTDDYFSASIDALYNLSKEVDLSWLRGYLGRSQGIER